MTPRRQEVRQRPGRQRPRSGDEVNVNHGARMRPVAPHGRRPHGEPAPKRPHKPLAAKRQRERSPAIDGQGRRGVIVADDIGGGRPLLLAVKPRHDGGNPARAGMQPARGGLRAPETHDCGRRVGAVCGADVGGDPVVRLGGVELRLEDARRQAGVTRHGVCARRQLGGSVLGHVGIRLEKRPAVVIGGGAEGHAVVRQQRRREIRQLGKAVIEVERLVHAQPAEVVAHDRVITLTADPRVISGGVGKQLRAQLHCVVTRT